MPFTKRDGAGIIVERATGTNLDWLGPWETIDGVMGTVPLPAGQARTYDYTTHAEAAATGFTQKRNALNDVVEISIPLGWDPDWTQHQNILADEIARTVRQYRFRPFGVTRKYGCEGQCAVEGLTADINGPLAGTLKIAVGRVNFNVA